MTSRQATMHAHAQGHAQVHPHAHAQPHVVHTHRRRPLLVRAVHLTLDRFLLFPLGAVIAVVWANTAAESYFTMAQRLSFVVNEIGMALFFALLTQEIAEAIVPGGALHSWRRWAMPLAAACGGAIGAVAVYVWFVNWVYESQLTQAWPIACAIDVAATYYLLKAIMPRSGALPFAVLVGITTDLFGMLVVAPSYVTLQTRVGGVALMTAALMLAVAMRALNVRAFWPYLLVCGTMSWIAFFWEGLHPAFALVPIVPFLPHEPRRLDLFADPVDDDPVHHAEHEWHLVVQPIAFLFGLVNAGVVLRGYEMGSWGMFLAGFVGRPIGMLVAVGIAVAAGLHLPRHVGWREILVVALATSSGFSIALFFATGVLGPGPLLAEVKIGLFMSLLGALLAVVIARALKVGKFAVSK